MTDLLETRCRCGVMVMTSPRSAIEALCIECRYADCGTSARYLPQGDWHPSVGYASPGMGWRMAPLPLRPSGQASLPAGVSRPDAPLVAFPMRIEWERTQPRAEATPYPRPVHTSRDGWMPADMPASVLHLATFAREASWEVVTQCAQGNPPHGATGRPLALRTSIVLGFGLHPMTDMQAYAEYSAPVGGKWAWASFVAWRPGQLSKRLPTLDAMKAFLAMKS